MEQSKVSITQSICALTTSSPSAVPSAVPSGGPRKPALLQTVQGQNSSDAVG
jgi:hypothetical protein